MIRAHVYCAIAFAMMIGALALVPGWFYLPISVLSVDVVFWSPIVGLALAAASQIPMNRYSYLEHRAYMERHYAS